MKNLFTFFSLVLLLISCNKEEACIVEDNSDLFDTVWSTFSQEYAAFEITNIDWNALRDQYRPMVDKTTTDEELFEVFKALLFELKDGHVDMRTDSILGDISCVYN